MTHKTLTLAALLLAIPQASPAQASPLLQQMTAAAAAQRTLSADLTISWNGAGTPKQSTGTIRLSKPNLAIIRLSGDYSLHLLTSDGTSRFLSEAAATYTQAPTSPHGETIDTPWWALPVRFFFTQSLNPFGPKPDPTATYETLAPQTIDGITYQVLLVHGSSPMGGYSAKLFFNPQNLLARSSVEFGSGPNAARFDAQLTHIVLNRPQARGTFAFVPAPGQVLAATTDNMLPLGTPAPDFTLPTTTGDPIKLSADRQGARATIINFWYYTCAPCRIEFPELEKLYQQFHPQGLNLIAIDKADTAQTVAAYARKTGLTFPVLLGGDLKNDSVFTHYKVTESFPGTYLLDSDGKIVYRATGEDIQGLKQALAKLGFQ